MTERRPGQERGRGQGKPGGAPTPHDTQEDALLELQELAGNRAVADLLAEGRASAPPASPGLRVRDLLRLARQPARAAVQRQPADPYKEGADKTHDQDDAAPGDKAWEQKADGGEKAREKEGAEEAGAGEEKAAWGEESAGDEKSAGGEKPAGLAGPTPMLTVGSAGPAVVRLQSLLAAAGYAVSPDGVFGPRTRAAVIAFQASRNLNPDGIVGPKTWGALQAPGAVPMAPGPGGLAATGEMELVEPGPAMEKAGAVEGGGRGARAPGGGAAPGGWGGGGRGRGGGAGGGGVGGGGEATLPDEPALKKEGAQSEAKLPEAEVPESKEWE